MQALKIAFSCLLLASSSVAPVSADDKESCAADAMIVFDASGSMAATDVEGVPSRIDMVRQALKKILPPVSKVRNLGLVVYGPGRSANMCQNVVLKFPPKPDAGNEIMSEVKKLSPAGNTPLTSGVKIAADALEQSRKPAAIVLLTDGEETCGGDPCALGRQLRISYPGVVVHIIGYKLQSLDGGTPVSGAKCLADQTGGYNASANTLDELVSALSKMLSCPEITSTSP
jgi:Ca-activated chloride channel homolog